MDFGSSFLVPKILVESVVGCLAPKMDDVVVPRIDGLVSEGFSSSEELELSSSAPGANPSSSMKSASDTFVGSPHMKPPLGGSGAAAGGATDTG